MFERFMMRSIGESKNGRRVAAVGFTLLGAGGLAAGLAASGELGSTKNSPLIIEAIKSQPDKVVRMAGQICLGNKVYGVVDNKIEQVPNSACNYYSVSNSNRVSVRNNNGESTGFSQDGPFFNPDYEITINNDN